MLLKPGFNNDLVQIEGWSEMKEAIVAIQHAVSVYICKCVMIKT